MGIENITLSKSLKKAMEYSLLFLALAKKLWLTDSSSFYRLISIETHYAALQILGHIFKLFQENVIRCCYLKNLPFS